MPDQEYTVDQESPTEALTQLDDNDETADAFEDHHEALYRHLNDDGSLRKLRWAADTGFDRIDKAQTLRVDHEDGGHDMAHASATGDALVSNGQLGIDLIRLDRGEGFVPHTHPGDHILLPVLGAGTITYDGDVYPSNAGEVYIIEGDVPHGVGAITEHAILAVGAPHAPIDSDERMTPVEYEEVTAEYEDMNCLICETETTEPTKLHEAGCRHCPCYDCMAPDGEAEPESEVSDE